MGKNQNPWRECQLGLMRDEGGPLARRISGGGTVYHDAGNLNYCVIVDRTQYREEQAYEMVFQALETLGIHAERTGKSNLSVGGLKFSGNAFCFRKGRALHHGTLLLNTDLKRLSRYLGSMFESIDTHAIRSIPANVTNLNLAGEAVAAALRKSFQSTYGGGRAVLLAEIELDSARLAEFSEKQSSDDWKYAATPRFAVEYQGRSLEVVKGVVVSSEGFTQFLNTPFSITAFSLASNVD